MQPGYTTNTRTAPVDDIMTTYLDKELPTDMKELFSLVEYIAFNSGQVVSSLKKLTEFPITHTVYDTDNTKLKDSHESIAKGAKYKSASLAVGFDYNMYGNSITSVYKPITRYIICPHCKQKIRIREADFRYEASSDSFYLRRCPECHKSGKANIEDAKDLNEKKINIIRWDLKDIDIEYNQFTGKGTYYYNMCEEDKKKIRENNLEMLATYPRALLALAGKNGKYRFRFSDDYVYHMKTSCLCGISKVWGFPPPTPALKSFFHQMLLKKANQGVAMDYLNHLRVIYPEMSQPDNNPLKYINMSVWADEMTQTIKKWRQDKNFIKLSPHPLGYQALGGEGKAFLLTNEIREASYDILMTLGIPREMMEGAAASNIASPVFLRIIENMMMTYMEQMNDWINWIDKKVSHYFEIEAVDVSFTPFKFIDDVQQKSLLIQWGQGGEQQKVSDETIAEYLDLDLDSEEDRIKEETIRRYKLQKEISTEINELENSLEAQAARAAQQAQGNAVDYNNQQQTLAQADGIAQQMIQLPYEQRKSELLALQKEDYIMYSVVIQRMEELNTQMRTSATNAAKMASLREEITQEKVASMPSINKRQYKEGAFDKFLEPKNDRSDMVIVPEE